MENINPEIIKLNKNFNSLGTANDNTIGNNPVLINQITKNIKKK